MNKKKKPFVKKYRNKKKLNYIKVIIAFTTFIFSGLMVLGSTYAWFVSEDNKVNKFEGSKLSAEIIEEFEPNDQWQPGLKTDKVIQVRNTGKVPAFVRLSLYEYLLLFKIDLADQTGNGNLAVASEEKKPIVDSKKTTTWSLAAKENGTYDRNGIYYIAQKAIIPDRMTGNKMYMYNDLLRDKTELKWFNLFFPTNVYTSAPTTGTSNYWLFNKGYFYYSELLAPNETTEPVLTAVSLNRSAPNKMKGALYQLNPIMDAHDSTKSLLSEWNIGNTGDVYELFHHQLRD